MSTIDWILFVAFLAYVVWDGMRKSRKSHDSDSYFLAGRALPWWAIGLSIMATQASAITMVGTTGQGWAHGLSLAQFYYSLPLAMVILAFTAVPAYYRLRVTTAYEYLGHRFDEKTRWLSAVLFLILRGLSVGFVIFTPALVLASVFHIALAPTIVFMGGVAVVYTAIGGLDAVIRTDVKQMTMMVLGLLIALVAIILQLPDEIGLDGAIILAGAADRLEWIDLRWNPSDKYNIWSSLLGGTFLFLSYFGTDQSQVQRLLAGRSLRESQKALFLNAIFKVPFQLLVLFIGTLLFVFYLFQGTPLSFDPAVAGKRVMSAERMIGRAFVEKNERLRRVARLLVAADRAGEADDELRAQFKELVDETSDLREQARAARSGKSDTNFVFLDFILRHLPAGVVGLLLAAIVAAALSSIDSELNSMTTVVVLDLWQRLRRSPLEGAALVRGSRFATLAVGAFATTFALFLGDVGSLIEGVNRVGSYVYGSLLGAFLLAAIPKTNGHGAFAGLLTGMVVVATAAQTDLAFLWLNTVGVATVVIVGTVVSLLAPPTRSS